MESLGEGPGGRGEVGAEVGLGDREVEVGREEGAEVKRGEGAGAEGEAWREDGAEVLRREGGAGAESVGGAGVEEDTEVGAETEGVEVGRKHQSGLLLRPRGTGLAVFPRCQDRMTGMSRS